MSAHGLATPGLVRLLSVAAGVAVSSMYYHQPMLAALAEDLAIPAETVGWIPTATWSGYAAGILTLAPLGDRLDLRRMILAKLVCLIAALTLAAAAPNYAVLIAASFLVGLATTVVQDIVPYGANLAEPTRRTRVIAEISSGILLGNLAGRLGGGVIAGLASWRIPYAATALAVLALLPLMFSRTPAHTPGSKLGYFALLRSVGALVRRHPALVRATLTQMALFAAFGAFWATVARMFEADLGLSATAVGLLGLPAAVGALALPWIARLVPTLGTRRLIAIGIVLTVLPFLAMAMFGAPLAAVIIATAVIDVGLRFSLAAVQAIIFSLDPAANSRINTVYITTLFGGQALGSFAASAAWLAGGWSAVCLTSAGIALIAVVAQFWPASDRRS